MLVRGEDRYGHFEPVNPSASELDPAAIATRELAVSLYRETYFEQETLHEAMSA